MMAAKKIEDQLRSFTICRKNNLEQLVPDNVIERISSEFKVCREIRNINRWRDRLNKISVNNSPKALERNIRSHFFELDVMAKLHELPNISYMEYEPKPQSKGKNCDLMIKAAEFSYLIEIKYFLPENKKREIKYEHIPDNHNVNNIDEMIHHHEFSIRSRLIELISQIEEKFKNYQSTARAVLAVPTGFYISESQLNYFFYMYRYRKAHPLDYLGKMMLHRLNKEKKEYNGTIDELWAFHYTINGIDEMWCIPGI